MRAFRPIDHLFLLTLCGLFVVIVALQYYRPSSYLPSSEPKKIVYQSDSQTLNKVFQLAEDWDHTHETEESIKILPSIPPIPTTEEIDEILAQQEETEVPTPPIIEEEEEVEPEKASSWWWGFLLNPGSWFPTLIFLGILIAFIYYLFRLSRQAIDRLVQRDLNAIPLGVKRKQYQIAVDFQSTTVDHDWLEEIHEQEIEYLRSMQKGNFEVHYEDYLKMTVENFRPLEADRPKVSRLEKGVHLVKKWVNPEQELGEKFHYKFQWSDLWALISSALYNGLLFLLTPDDFRLLIVFLACYFIIFFINFGAFRRNKWVYLIGGVAFTILSAISALVFWLYNYLLAHPELLETDGNLVEDLLIPLGYIVATFTGVYLFMRVYLYLSKSKFGKKLNYWFTEPIWLRDASMGNVGLAFLAIAFLAGRANHFFGLSFFYSYFIAGVLWATAIANLGLWLFSPTPKQKAEEQWQLRPKSLALIIALSVAATSYLFYINYIGGILWWLAPVPLLSGIVYFFSFYRIDKMPYHLEKDEQKKEQQNLRKTVEAMEMDAKKLIRKTIPQNNKAINTDRWWDIDKVEAKGMLHLENRMLRNSSKELDHLLKFRQLRFLYLNNNLLEFVPEEIIWLKALRKLDLSQNRIGLISPQIKTLKYLTVLELANNEIRTLPPWIAEMKQLKILNLKGNAIPKQQIEQLQKKRPDLQIEWD